MTFKRTAPAQLGRLMVTSLWLCLGREAERMFLASVSRAALSPGLQVKKMDEIWEPGKRWRENFL